MKHGGKISAQDRTDGDGVVSLNPSAAVQTAWKRLQDVMRDEFGETIYRSWLQPLRLQAYYHGTIEVSIHTRHMKDWISTHYAARLVELCAKINPEIRRLELVVVPNAAETVDDAGGALADIMAAKSNANMPVLPRKPALDAELSSPLDPRFTFESFVVGKSNALAHAAARRVVESASVPFNPLFLYGGVGLGKTHLMHAIAWSVQTLKPDLSVLYLSAEKFMYQFVRALRSQDMMHFKEQLRAVDILMVDDIQFVSGKEQTQEEFFHTFNALVDQGKQIVISADRAPGDLAGIDERLRSRLSWGLVADIQPSTYDLRLGILQSKRTQLKAAVPDDVLDFLALKITSNIRELEGAMNRIVAHADVSGSAITLDTTQDVLQDLLRTHDRRITIDEIQRKVADHFGLRLPDMHSPRRSRNVARPRQIAMYLAKVLTPRSLPEIGRKFGGRDHTTVMHAVKKIEELMAEDPSIAQDVDVLKRALTG